jgi:hypothetical protein
VPPLRGRVSGEDDAGPPGTRCGPLPTACACTRGQWHGTAERTVRQPRPGARPPQSRVDAAHVRSGPGVANPASVTTVRRAHGGKPNQTWITGRISQSSCQRHSLRIASANVRMGGEESALLNRSRVPRSCHAAMAPLVTYLAVVTRVIPATRNVECARTTPPGVQPPLSSPAQAGTATSPRLGGRPAGRP